MCFAGDRLCLPWRSRRAHAAHGPQVGRGDHAARLERRGGVEPLGQHARLLSALRVRRVRQGGNAGEARAWRVVDFHHDAQRRLNSPVRRGRRVLHWKWSVVLLLARLAGQRPMTAGCTARISVDVTLSTRASPALGTALVPVKKRASPDSVGERICRVCTHSQRGWLTLAACPKVRWQRAGHGWGNQKKVTRWSRAGRLCVGAAGVATLFNSSHRVRLPHH